MRRLLLVPFSVAWATLRPGTVVFEIAALALAALITVELAEAKGWELPSWLQARPGGSADVASDASHEDGD